MKGQRFMKKRLLERIHSIFRQDMRIIDDGLVLVYKANMLSLGLLINLDYLEFKVVKVEITHYYEQCNSSVSYKFDTTLYELFNGIIHTDKGIVFEFECQEDKNGPLVNNTTNLMSSLRPIFDVLNYNGIAVCLTFACEVRKTYYSYNNNVFWSPFRKKTFSCNQREKERARRF